MFRLTHDSILIHILRLRVLAHMMSLLSCIISPMLLLSIQKYLPSNLEFLELMLEPIAKNSLLQVYIFHCFHSYHTDISSVSYAYRNQLFLWIVHKGIDSNLWFTMMDSNNSFRPDFQFPDHKSSRGVGLALFERKIHCVQRGNDDVSLWYTWFDGISWNRDWKFPNHVSSEAPVSKFNINELICARHWLYLMVTSFAFTKDQAIPIYGSRLKITLNGGPKTLNLLWEIKVLRALLLLFSMAYFFACTKYAK